ncbi:MAG: four helix bundle protein [Acidobacteriaceae bacterium]|jgi:four helix bundle protein
MRTRHFKELLVWQRATELARQVYRVSQAFPKDEIFGLRSQVRRAAVSVPSNIAEGHGRLSDPLFRTFLAQARGSLYEVETQLMLAADFGYIAEAEATELQQMCDEVARMLHGLLNSLRVTKPTAA